MKTVKYDVVFDEKASRMELLVRFFWSIPVYIVYIFVAMAQFFILVAQWFHILFTGKRHRELRKWNLMATRYIVNWYTYIYLLTDERNPIVPEGLE